MSDKQRNQAHQLRKQRDEIYQEHRAQPTEVNGIMVRSRLEALWIEALSTCETFKCVECVLVPVWVEGPFGKFLTNYKPDLVVELKNGEQILVELKPTRELLLNDDRQQRALKLNPKMRFMVIAGYPYTKKGLAVRLLTGKGEKVFDGVSVCDVLNFFECPCKEA